MTTCFMGSYLHLLTEGHFIFNAKNWVDQVLFCKNEGRSHKTSFSKKEFFQPTIVSPLYYMTSSLKQEDPSTHGTPK